MTNSDINLIDFIINSTCFFIGIYIHIYMCVLKSTPTGPTGYPEFFVLIFERLSQPSCILFFVWIDFVFDTGDAAHKGIHDHFNPEITMNIKGG